MKLVFLALALAVFVMHDVARADAALNGNAFSGRDVRSHLIGTMAPVGSFEFKAAATYTALADYRDTVTDKLIAGKIGVDVAMAAQNGADGVRTLLDDALRACAQNNKTGACTKDAGKAKTLLAQAKVKLKALR